MATNPMANVLCMDSGAPMRRSNRKGYLVCARRQHHTYAQVCLERERDVRLLKTAIDKVKQQLAKMPPGVGAPNQARMIACFDAMEEYRRALDRDE